MVLVLVLAGLRWGELAGLQVGDLVSVPGPGPFMTCVTVEAGAIDGVA